VIVWFEKKQHALISVSSREEERKGRGRGSGAKALSGAEPKTCPKIGTQVS